MPEATKPSVRDELDLASVVGLVSQLPRDVLLILAEGSLPDEEGCRACRALQRLVNAPIDVTPANHLSHWHSKLVRHVAGHGWQQDATRAGAMYGIAAALLRGGSGV